MPFAGMDVHFQVKNGILTVCEITEYKKSDKNLKIPLTNFLSDDIIINELASANSIF